MILSSEELVEYFIFRISVLIEVPQSRGRILKLRQLRRIFPLKDFCSDISTYRGQTREIRLKREDRFRHFYVIGQTGTGKSSILQSMIRQDLKNGEGLLVLIPTVLLLKIFCRLFRVSALMT